MQKNIHIDDIQRSFAKTGNEKFVLVSGKDKYQFYGTELNEDSLPKKQFVELGVKPNMDVEVEYLEEPEQFTGKDGNLVNWTKRSVRGIFPASGTPTPPQAQTPNSGANNSSQATSNKQDDKYWDMKAYKQCLWNYWLESQKEMEDGLRTGAWKDKVWNIFKEIEDDAKKRFFDFDKRGAHLSTVPSEPLPEELPIIQTQDIDVDSIPF